MRYTLAEAIERVGPQWLALIPEAGRALEYEDGQLSIRLGGDRIQQERTLLNGPLCLFSQPAKQTERKPEMEPHRMGNHFCKKSMAMI